MTTNNLIGYDPLAWMDGEVIEDTPPPSPAKKVTKSRAKAKAEPVEIAEEPIAIAVEDNEEPAAELSVVEEDAVEPIADDESVEMDVTIDEDGDIEISIEANEDAHVSVEISIDAPQSDDEIIDAIVEEVTEEISETPEAEIPVEEPAVEEVAKAPEEKIEPLIDLNADATIKNIEKLYNTIKRALDVHNTIEINASDVTTIDTAMLQLLVSLKKDAPCLNKTIDIIYPSARFIESAKLLDLLSILDVTES